MDDEDLQPYRGMIGHAVGPRVGEVVWVADAIDHAHRIAPDSLAEVELALDSGNTSPGCGGGDGRGAGFVLMLSWQRRPEGAGAPATGSSAWRPMGMTPASGPTSPAAARWRRWRRTPPGEVLGPCSEGQRSTGRMARWCNWALEPTAEGGNPQGALSRSGESGWCSSRARRASASLPSGRADAFDADIRQLSRVQVADDGTPFVAARVGIPYGLFALGDGPPRRLTEALGAEVSHDGRWVIETLVNQVRLRDVRQRDGIRPGAGRARGHFPGAGRGEDRPHALRAARAGRRDDRRVHAGGDRSGPARPGLTGQSRKAGKCFANKHLTATGCGG
ncbi:MAG: hypothetical protein R3F60_18635 [bacterium]